MAQYNVNAMVVNLMIFDTPVGYTPPRGPSVEFVVTYNQRESSQPAIFTYPNLGSKWTFNWLSYVDINPEVATDSVDLYLPGGGVATFSSFKPSGPYVLDYSGQALGGRIPEAISAPQQDSGARLARFNAGVYELLAPDGSIQVFSTGGAGGTRLFLTKMVDPQGNSVQIVYDTNFRITALVDALGQATTISYGSNFASNPGYYRIVQVTDPFQRSATFNYDNQGRLWKITDVIGITSQFNYTVDGWNHEYINQLITPYGTTSFASNDIVNQQGLIASRILIITDPLGGRERVQFQGFQLPTTSYPMSMPSSVVPDPNVFPVNNNYMNARNTFYWDKKAMENVDGYNTPPYTTAKVFHWLHAVQPPGTPELASHILEATKEPLEAYVWYRYEGQGSITKEDNITQSRPVTIARVLDGSITQVQRLTYNDLGKVTSVIDPLGRQFTYGYDPTGMDLREVRQTKDGSNELLAQATYNTQHLPLTVTDASGRVTSFSYNAQGQVLTVTNPKGETTTLAYNTYGYLTNATGPVAGSTTTLTYDYFGRPGTVTDSDGYVVTMTYDALDRPVRVAYPDGTFEKVSYNLLDAEWMQDRLGRWSHLVHNALQQVTAVQDPLGRTTSLQWCGCGSLESITDPLGRGTTWTRDGEGRVIVKTYTDNKSLTYTYETNTSRLKEVTDAKGQTTHYDYNLDDRLAQVSYPNSNLTIFTPSVSFTYDVNYGRLLTMTDGVGTTTFNYNPINGAVGSGLVGSIVGPWSNVANDTVSYGYDPLGRVTSENVAGGAAQSVTYDSLGRVTAASNPLGNFTYNYVGVSGRVSSMNYPNGQVTTFNYLNLLGDLRLSEIKHQQGTGILSKFDYTYDAEGRILTWSQQAGAAGQVYGFSYDAADQLKTATSGLQQFAYGYDTAGNRTREQIQTGGNTAMTTGAYNSINQLTGRSGGGTVQVAGTVSEPSTVTVNGALARVNKDNSFEAYPSLSPGAQTITVVARDYSNNARTNKYQITVTDGGGTKSLAYDLNGNCTSVSSGGSTVTYDWDAADRLVAIHNGGLQTQFTYDGFGRRVRIVELQSGVVTSDKKFRCGGRVSDETTIGGTAVTKRFFGQGEQINGANYYFTRDHLGSVREMVDGSGNVRARYDYDPFGRRTKIAGDLEADFGFTGHYYHAPSKLHLTRFRAYDADTGRWLSRDPIEEAGGLNLYAYVGNNPINAIDPLGLDNIWDVTSGQNAPPALTIVAQGNSIHTYYPDGDPLIFMANGIVMSGPIGGVLGIVDGYEDATDKKSDALTRVGGGLRAGGLILLSVVGMAQAIKCPASAAAEGTLQTTAHGAERIAGAAATRGGVLSEAGVAAVRQSGRLMTQADGATVRILQNEAGRFNVVVEGQRGIITTFENLSQKSLDRLGKNYGWK